MAFDALAGESAASVTNASFSGGDGTQIGAYLARPTAAAAQPLPAVLMIHEWWGLNAEIAEMANLLAAQGYVVLAPDTYRGNLATTVPGALLLRLMASADRVDDDVQAAYDYLTTLPEVDPVRVGIIGFCYGGGVALRHATLNAGIAATVNLYGDTIDDAQSFGALAGSSAPLLGVFGEQDAQIPLAEVAAFEAALAETSIPHTVTIYSGVGHAFVNPHGIEAGGAPADAWAEILAFLAASLQADEAVG
jgi:carboxymethylenebutenolidase